MILQNISGNRTYQINCEEGYIVNIDNFFKMCLITQRMRLNIPIVIMGEAGIGKTALLRHVVQHLYKDEFAVYNINAGLPIET
jgi:Cdc6-like AAA superfamily ATPase